MARRAGSVLGICVSLDFPLDEDGEMELVEKTLHLRTQNISKVFFFPSETVHKHFMYSG